MRNLYNARYICLFIFCLLILPIQLNGQTDNNISAYNSQIHHYTKAHPLIVEGLWSLWPLSYLNEEGVPMGIDIDMTKHLLNKLNIPYVIKLRYREDVLTDLRSGKAQLSWGTYTNTNRSEFRFCNQTIIYLTHAVAYRKGEVHLTRFRDLKDAKIIVHNGSGAQDRLQNAGWGKHAQSYEDMRMALYEVNNRNTDFVVWNSLCLTYLKNTLHFDSLEVDNLEGMQPSAYKFMGTDSVLLFKLDSVFAKENAAGNLSDIYDQWVYNQSKAHFPTWIIGIAILIICTFIILLILNFIYRRRMDDENQRIALLDGRLALALKSGNIMLWVYNVKENTFFRLDNKEDIKSGTLFMEFIKYIKPNQKKRMKMNFKMMIEGKKDSAQDIFFTNYFSDGKQRVYEVVANVMERDKYGQAIKIVGTNKDITEHYERKVNEKDLMLRYKTIFNSAMLSISYFDKDGIYIDVNENWCKYFNIKNKSEFLKTKPTVKQIWGEQGQYFVKKDLFWAASDFKLPQVEEDNLRYAQQQKNIIIENRIVPIYDNNNQFIGCSSSFIDITEKVKSFKNVNDYLEKTKKAMIDIQIYADNINHVLKSCGIRIFWLNKKDSFFRISNDANNPGREYSKDIWMRRLTDDSKAKAENILDKIKNGFNQLFSIDIELYKDNKNLHYNFIGMPEYDKDGNIRRFFGLAMDISELARAQKELEEKKKVAQKADLLKSAFLKNMSFEIRTPLQAVVGFSELLSEVRNEEDEHFFVNEIKRNTNLLLKIVNDVLFLSKLDAGMIEVKKDKCDMAVLFKNRCSMARKGLDENKIEFIEECSFKNCILETDDSLITIILDNLLDNAKKFTKSGHIRASCRYEEGFLLIFVEDTGCGIPIEMLGKVFNRFVKAEGDERGSGLGLSFCKVITELLNGNIHIDSNLDRGTMVWVRIPCLRILTDDTPEIQ